MNSIEKLARDLERVQQDIINIATNPRLHRSSLDSGAIELRDIDGNTTGYVGMQSDGTFTSAPVGGTPPPIPTGPLVVPSSGGLLIYWDGTFVDASPTRMDWRRTSFHVVTDVDDFDPLDATQIAGSISIATGGEIFVTLPPVEHFVFAVAWTEAGKFSVESDPGWGTPFAVVSSEMWEEHEAKLDELNDVTLPALQTDLADAQEAVSTRARIIMSPAEPTGLTADDRVFWLDTDGGYASSYWDGTDWSPYALGAEAIAAGAIIATHIAVGAIVAEHLSADSVTADAIAANSVNVNHLAADSVTANAIAAGAVDGTVITGALFRTAPDGERIEITTAGLLQFDAVNTLITRIGVAGNMFSGVVDATSIRVRDGLELFGQNNMFASNAKVTLQTGQTGPSSPPSMYTKYASEDLLSLFRNPYWYLNGYWENAAGTTQCGVANEYSGGGLLIGPGGDYFYLGNSTNGFKSTRANAQVVDRYKHPEGYTRFTSSGVEKAVFSAGLVYDGFPDGAFEAKTLVCVDDAPMTGTGSTRPTILAETLWYNFSWYRSYGLGRVFGPVGGPTGGRETIFAAASIENTTSIGGTDLIDLRLYQLAGANLTVNYAVNGVNFAPLRISGDEGLLAVHYGSSHAMGMSTLGSATDVWLIQTTHQNIVLSSNGVTRHTTYEWPVIPDSTGIAFAAGDLLTNGCSAFGTVNRGANVDTASTQRIKWYSNFSWVGTSSVDKRVWAQFAWRGHSSKSPEWLTTPSTLALPFIPAKRSMIGLSVPALPPPEAGVGAARDVDKDVYGWVLYMGQGEFAPGNGAMYRQSASPSGDPTTVSSIELSDFPTLSGSNPLTATANFPNASPAKIVSSAASGGVPLLSLDGDGNVLAKTLSVSDVTTLMKQSIHKHIASPSNPASGYSSMFFKSDTHLYTRSSGGVERPITSSPVSYVPSVTGLTGASNTIAGSYVLDANDIIYLRVLITLGASGTVNGHVAINLPFSLAADYGFSVIFKDATGGNYKGGHTTVVSGGTINCYTIGTAGVQGVLSTTAPFTWAVNDAIEVNGVFRKV